jgi:hypothetical protein
VSAATRLAHLAHRFFGFLTAAPLGPDEQAFVARQLATESAALFWSQQYQDQRHAVQVAMRVAGLLPDDEPAVRAALLHDVGKRHSRLGATGRAMATVLDGLRLPMTARMRSYRAHGPVGADDLEVAGCGELEIAFARHHPDPAPELINEEQWSALLEADG